MSNQLDYIKGILMWDNFKFKINKKSDQEILILIRSNSFYENIFLHVISFWTSLIYYLIHLYIYIVVSLHIPLSFLSRISHPLPKYSKIPPYPLGFFYHGFSPLTIHTLMLFVSLFYKYMECNPAQHSTAQIHKHTIKPWSLEKNSRPT